MNPRALLMLIGVTALLVASGCKTARRRAGPTATPPVRVTPLPPAAAAAKPRVVPAKPPPSPAVRTDAWQQESAKWIGPPYRWGGSDRRGIDCSGFTLQMYQAVAKLPLPRTAEHQFLTGKPVAREELRTGDLVFFNTTRPGASHVGLWLGDGHFVHASTSRGVTISSLTERYWSARFLGGKRLLSFGAGR